MNTGIFVGSLFATALCALAIVGVVVLLRRRALATVGGIALQEERRNNAAGMQQAIFYDLSERMRLWGALRAMQVLCFVLGALLCISVCGNFWLLPKTWHADTFGYTIHDNGDVSPLGSLRPGQPATVQEKKAVAGHFVENLFTVTSPNSQGDLKRQVLAHTASGAPASTFVSRFYSNQSTNPFVLYKESFRKVKVLGIDASVDGSRYTVTFDVTPIDEFDTPKSDPVRHVAHLELVQNRTGDTHVLWDNPNEVYVTYIDDDGGTTEQSQ
jgi:hypothetical protein